MSDLQAPESPLRALRYVIWGMALGFALLVGGVAAWQAFMPRASELPVLRLGGDFTLINSDGKPFTLASQRGRLALLTFGFTSCPDVCPLTLARYRAVLAALQQDAARLQPIMISVDPARDTPAKLGAYVHYFDQRIVGLTGSREQLALVARQYGAIVNVPVAGETGEVSHSDYLYLIDDLGRVRRLYDQQAPVQDIVREVRGLLREARGR